jgi:hypothetical protein
MKGTLTFHLPLERGPQTPPQMTVVVRRIMKDRFHAGAAFCSAHDQFVRRVGRRVACHRLQGRPFMADSALELVQQLDLHADVLSENRPGSICQRTIADLYALVDRISQMRIE